MGPNRSGSVSRGPAGRAGTHGPPGAAQEAAAAGSGYLLPVSSSPSPDTPPARRAWAPGRVNLIGDHTDTTGGFALPMAIQLGVEASFQALPEAADRALLVRSAQEPEPARIPLDALSDPGQIRRLSPPWARYVAAVGAAVPDPCPATGEVRSDLPAGAGLSSSAALELAVALALGFAGSALELARACRAAEEVAVGVPCGLMDQLTSAAGVEGSALLLDTTAETAEPVPLPGDLEVVVAHSGQARSLAGSAYAERFAEVRRAERTVGPLRQASLADLEAIADPVVRRRARHVVTENARVLAAVDALRSGDLQLFGACVTESHASLAGDYDVSTPALDALSGWLSTVPGCFGARLTGAGFGGCVVALGEPGLLARAQALRALPGAAWVMHPTGAARLLGPP